MVLPQAEDHSGTSESYITGEITWKVLSWGKRGINTGQKAFGMKLKKLLFL